jgi:hypothetical protein
MYTCSLSHYIELIAKHRILLLVRNHSNHKSCTDVLKSAQSLRAYDELPMYACVNLLLHQTWLINHRSCEPAPNKRDDTPLPILCLVADRKRLLLRAKSFLDDILAILPELSGVLNTKAVIEHIFDLFQAETRHLGVEEICSPLSAI